MRPDCAETFYTEIMNEGIAPKIILYSVHYQTFFITGIKL